MFKEKILDYSWEQFEEIIRKAIGTNFNVSEFLEPIECISFFEAWIFASCRNDGILEYWNDGF